MEKIIGGIDFNSERSIKLSAKLLWPCYEFVAEVEGLEDNYNRNIIEETVLKLAAIGEVEPAMVEKSTGMPQDLISFVHARLQQKNLLDDYGRVTEEGNQQIDKYSKPSLNPIHIYVDALSGKMIPYYTSLTEKNHLNFHSFEGPDSKKHCKYKLFSSTGTEGEEQQAYMLHHKGKPVPDPDDVSEMLYKLKPQKTIVVHLPSQPQQGTLCYVLLDITIWEGDIENWIFSDGFGYCSMFYSKDKICNQEDTEYISRLREQLQKDTNASAPKQKNSIPFPRLQEKIKKVSENFEQWQENPLSPDEINISQNAKNECILALHQLMEWALYELLHNEVYKDKARESLNKLKHSCENLKDARQVIGNCAIQPGKKLGFNLPEDVAHCMKERYGRIDSAWKGTPTLFALVDLLLISLEQEDWLQTFAHEYPDFISRLAHLNKMRNQSFHAGNICVEKSDIKKIREEIFDFIKVSLQVEIKDGVSELSLKEEFRRENKMSFAISATEKDLGFALYDILDFQLLHCVKEMESYIHKGNEEIHCNDALVDNAIILEQYKALERIFTLVNKSLGNTLKNSDWKEKIADLKDCEEAIKSLDKTNPDRIKKALERKPSSMNATCIAFLTLASDKLLKEIKIKWPHFLSDINYIVQIREHGEIPKKIDQEKALNIKDKIIELIKFLAKEGFLTVN